MEAVSPHVIEEGLYRFDCKLNELVSCKAGSQDLITHPPFSLDEESIVLFSIQCNDGIFFLILEKRV